MALKRNRQSGKIFPAAPQPTCATLPAIILSNPKTPHMSALRLFPPRKVALPKIALLLIASAALLAACRKRGESSNILSGSWELRQAFGSFVNNYPAGNGHLLLFAANSYSFYAGGQLQKAGTYTVVPDGTATENVCLVLPAGEYTSRIRYDNNDSIPKQFFQINNDSLTIVSGCFAYDAGVESIYVRVTN